MAYTSAQLHAGALRFAKDEKLRSLRAGEPMSFHVLVTKGDVLLIVDTRTAHRDVALAAAHAAVAPLGGRTCTLVLDTYYRQDLTVEDLGEVREGDLQRAFEAGDPAVCEALLVSTVARGLRPVVHNTTLRYDVKGDRLTWREEPVDFESDSDQGIVPGRLLAIMAEPALALPPGIAALPEEARWGGLARAITEATGVNCALVLDLAAWVEAN